MQLLPRNSNRLAPARQAASMTWVSIRRLSSRKSAGRLRLASMPPTVAAASTTTSGLLLAHPVAHSSIIEQVEFLPAWGEQLSALELDCHSRCVGGLARWRFRPCPGHRLQKNDRLAGSGASSCFLIPLVPPPGSPCASGRPLCVLPLYRDRSFRSPSPPGWCWGSSPASPEPGGISEQGFYFRRAEITRVDSHHHLTGVTAATHFLEAFTIPLQRSPAQLRLPRVR